LTTRRKSVQHLVVIAKTKTKKEHQQPMATKKAAKKPAKKAAKKAAKKGAKKGAKKAAKKR
jgi:hypothetical protein